MADAVQMECLRCRQVGPVDEDYGVCQKDRAVILLIGGGVPEWYQRKHKLRTAVTEGPQV
jgi:hypothetical protein